MNRNTLRNLILPAVLACNAAHSLAVPVVSITVAPPPLRVYAQPPCPADGYIWTPGYWAYGPAGYTWAPGAWVLPPQPGYLFTPGYWDFVGGAYVWHLGHWGLHVGYYGGVNYGFGYPGAGFFGGRWEGGHFFYNREVSNVGERFHNTYREKVLDHGRDRASFHDQREEQRAGRRGDRKEDRRGDRKEDRKEHHDERSHERPEHNGNEHAHPTKVAAHSGSASGHKSEHHARG
jgi:WXXGXW repeat (2 copies)